ncbi:MAG: GspMb/PilO family protein [Pyrinomonadaceae bacterium]
MNNEPEPRPEDEQPQIHVNDYGSTLDSTVVVEEADRTVLLTDNETIVFPKATAVDVVPKDRPRKVYMGMWGQTEIITVGFAALAVIGVVLLYLFLVAPSNRELEQNIAERDRLDRELLSARSKYGDITSTETQVSKLITSVDDFEARYLPNADNGRTALYQRINGLIGAYGLVNTTGPDYAPLEVADVAKNNQSDEERGRGKFRSLFPGVYVTMTVEGSYQNLRRFLREIETGTEFVIVSSVEIQPSEAEKPKADNSAAQARAAVRLPQYDASGMPVVSSTNPAPPRISGPRGKTRGEVVSLRLEMAAYFRRPNSAAMPAVQQ